MLGNFNMVEDAIDRLPMHEERNRSPETLRELKHTLRLHDGWRSTFPDTKAYSFHQIATGIHSRIDRIYVTNSLLEWSQKWEINPTGIPNADHWMVSTNLVNSAMPETGKGRWSISPKIHKDITFKKTVREARKTTIETLDNYTPEQRTMMNNPQTTYATFKDKIMSQARKREQTMSKMAHEAQKLLD
ncbi:hypothetical protein L208DRAFT_1551242, partial [Tricholoma matsutake]